MGRELRDLAVELLDLVLVARGLLLVLESLLLAPILVVEVILLLLLQLRNHLVHRLNHNIEMATLPDLRRQSSEPEALGRRRDLAEDVEDLVLHRWFHGLVRT